MPNVWIDEERMCLNLYEDCILEYKLNPIKTRGIPTIIIEQNIENTTFIEL